MNVTMETKLRRRRHKIHSELTETGRFHQIKALENIKSSELLTKSFSPRSHTKKLEKQSVQKVKETLHRYLRIVNFKSYIDSFVGCKILCRYRQY